MEDCKRCCEYCKHAEHVIENGIFLMPLDDGTFTGLVQCKKHSAREGKVVLSKFDETCNFFEMEDEE